MQIVGYRPSGSDPPAVVLAAEGETWTEPLTAGRELSYTLGDRRCAGTVHEDRHEPCHVESAPYCDAHTRPRYVPATSDEPHAVYLAGFAPDLTKVGITRAARLDRRLQEQGADRGLQLTTVPDGAVAWVLEAAIDAVAAATETELTQRVRVSQKLPGIGAERPASLVRSVAETLIADAPALAETAMADETVQDRATWLDEPLTIDRLREWFAALGVERELSFDYADVHDRPIPETVLSGTVRGVQGRVLLLDWAGTTYAVDMRELVGHEVTDGTADRDLQSSLGAFG